VERGGLSGGTYSATLTSTASLISIFVIMDLLSGNCKFFQKSTARRGLVMRGANVVLDSVGANRADVVEETAEGEFNNRLRRSSSFEE